MNHKLLSPSRDLNTGPADYKSAALPAKPLGRHIPLLLVDKKDGDGDYPVFFSVSPPPTG